VKYLDIVLKVADNKVDFETAKKEILQSLKFQQPKRPKRRKRNG
jgi:hypothetical protein